MGSNGEPAGESLEAALATVGKDLERQIAGAMQGLTGMIVRAHLPQVWVFVTERETASLQVDRQGKVSAAAGAIAPADVTVETSYERLTTALRTRDRARVPPGPFRATPHTEKGRRAFDLLKKRLGL